MLHRPSRLGGALALSFLSACGSPVEKDIEEPDTSHADTDAAGPLDPDCIIDESLFDSVQAEPAIIQTVLRTSWQLSAPAEARVLYADNEDAEVLETPFGAVGTTGTVNLVGLLPSRTFTIQIEAVVAGDHRCSPPVTVRTGTLPSDLPATVLTVNDTERAVRGWQSVALIRESVRYAAILNADGQFVWAQMVPGIYRATISRDRRSVLANEPASVWNGVGRLHRLPLDGVAGETIEVPGSHTDFVELPDGTLTTLGWRRKSFRDDTRYLLGDTIIEVRPDGTQVEIWDIFDAIEPNLDHEYARSPVSGGAGEPFLEEWSHVNSITYDEASDDYLVTGSFNHSVMRIDRGTGALVWTLTDGGATTDWTVVSDEREIELPHSAQLIDEETVLSFSRGPLGSPETPAGCAWVTEFALESATHVATPSWHYDADECVTVPFLGQARRIDDHNTMINWTAAGRISQTDADGEIVYQVDLGLGSAFGTGKWVASLY